MLFVKARGSIEFIKYLANGRLVRSEGCMQLI